MRIKKLAFLSSLFAVLLPTLVVATVVLSYTYPTSTSGVAPTVYLAQGPNYAAANAMNLFYAYQTSGSTPNISSGTKIYINYTAGANNEALLNVLKIVNNVKPGMGAVTITFTTLSLPSGVTMYISQTVNTTLTSSVSGATISISNGNPVSTSTGSITIAYGSYYIGFLFSNTATTGTGTIAFYYTVS